MVKADLKKSSGLNIIFNGETLEFTDIDYLSALDISVDLMRPHLLNQELTCPDIFYTKYFEIDKDGVYKKKKLKVNFYLIKPNLAGIEYVKTRSTRTSKYPRILEVVYGGGIILMQKFENKFESDIKITGKTPLIKQILRKYDKFEWLFKENSFTLD